MSAVYKIIEQAEQLPTLPSSAARLTVLLNDAEAGPAEFESVIRTDPALTTNLLRMCNSPYFGMHTEVTSVRQAIGLLGTRRLYDIVSAQAFRQVIPDHMSGVGLDAEEFWRHSLAVAVLAEGLAAELQVALPDLTFTAGLMHDIGKLVLDVHLFDKAAEIRAAMREKRIDFVAAEHEVIGLNHGEVGAMLATRWALPSTLLAPIQYHHNPSDAPADADRTLIDLIHVADALALSMGLGPGSAGLAKQIDPEAMARLGVTTCNLELVACESISTILEMGRPRQLFSLDRG